MFCVSDWHIDNGHNPFKNHYQRAHDFLDFVGDKPLLFIGDTLELWSCEWYEVWGGPYIDLIRRIGDRENVTIFQGNHDVQKILLHKFFPKAEITSSKIIGDRLILHGFQVDPLLDTPQERWLVAGLDRAFTLIDIPFLNALRDKIADMDRTNDPLIRKLTDTWTGCRYLLGHSHVEDDRGWFVNCGSLLRDLFPYVYLEENGDAFLKHF